MSGRGAAGASASGTGGLPANGGQSTGGASANTGGVSGSVGGVPTGGSGAGNGGVSTGGAVAGGSGRSGAPAGGAFPCDAIDCVEGRIVYVSCPGGGAFTNCDFATTGVECVKEGACPGSGEGGEGGRG